MLYTSDQSQDTQFEFITATPHDGAHANRSGGQSFMGNLFASFSTHSAVLGAVYPQKKMHRLSYSTNDCVQNLWTAIHTFMSTLSFRGATWKMRCSIPLIFDRRNTNSSKTKPRQPASNTIFSLKALALLHWFAPELGIGPDGSERISFWLICLQHSFTHHVKSFFFRSEWL